MRSAILAASLMAICLPAPVIAGPIFGEFTGTVWGVTESGASIPGGIGVGARVTGAFQFENTGQAPFQAFGDGIDQSSYLSYSKGSFLRISIGSFVWEASGLAIDVRNDSPLLGDDLLELRYYTDLQMFDPAFPPATSFPGIPPGGRNSIFAISLFDNLGPLDLVSSQALPGTVSEINLDSVRVMNGTIFGSANADTSAFYAINFQVDSVMMRDVPEPGSVLLMASGFLGAWRWMQRRRLSRPPAACHEWQSRA